MLGCKNRFNKPASAPAAPEPTAGTTATSPAVASAAGTGCGTGRATASTARYVTYTMRNGGGQRVDWQCVQSVFGPLSDGYAQQHYDSTPLPLCVGVFGLVQGLTYRWLLGGHISRHNNVRGMPCGVCISLRSQQEGDTTRR